MLTIEQLKERLFYNPENGLFTYIVKISNMKPGDIAGRANSQGHIQISINYKRYQAHNLAWLFMTGVYPINFIVDHKNLIRNDNRWINLRAATNSQNAQNTKMRKNNNSGYVGVYWHETKRKWIAQITFKGNKINLGEFITPELASDEYRRMASHLFGEFLNDLSN